jgi:short-subunit dehydrogenase
VRFTEAVDEVVADLHTAGATADGIAAAVTVAGEVERDGAAIVNTGSTGSLYGTARMCAYVASKHAVLGLTAATVVVR